MIKLHLNDLAANQHFVVVEKKIRNRIKAVLRSGINGAQIKPNRELRSYLTSLLIDDELKTLIIAQPKKLAAIARSIKRLHPTFMNSRTNSGKILYNIFISSCYENPIFNKLNFIKGIEIDTCPYCNRNYIYYLSKANRIKPQIDHFLPKKKYPFLGISFYNLIPSCQTCNGLEAKGQRDPLQVNLTNPYLLNTSDFKFTYRIKNINIVNALIDKTSLSVEFLNKKQGHLKVFKLDKLYQQHSDHVIELVIKSKIKYSDQYRSYLKQYTGLNFNDKQIDRMILGNYSTENEIHKRPLAKLYQDIGKELGLI